MPEEALPWVDLEPEVELDDPIASIYFSYLLDRPDSVLAALRAIASAPGAALVHCAAGKDRTGTLVALALSVAGAHGTRSSTTTPPAPNGSSGSSTGCCSRRPTPKPARSADVVAPQPSRRP